MSRDENDGDAVNEGEMVDEAVVDVVVVVVDDDDKASLPLFVVVDVVPVFVSPFDELVRPPTASSRRISSTV